jgi:isopentenyldiphosphate isomerase
MAEQFDILDINGTPTGSRADKGTPLKNEQYYLGVHVYIYNSSGKFLLQQRSHNKDFLPGGWDVILEHVLAGETSKEGAIRGIEEEIGLSVHENDMSFMGRFIWNTYHHIIDVYFVKVSFNVKDLSLQNEEVISAKMVSKDDMLELVSKMDYRPVEYRHFIACEIRKLIEGEELKNGIYSEIHMV